MRRGASRSLAARCLVALAVVLAVLPVGVSAPAPAQDSPTDTQAPIPPPAASIVIDVDTGEVITAVNERTALPPASTTKILTALLARQHLDFDGEIVVSPVANLAPPRRLNMAADLPWRVSDLMYAMMLCSCNDAAWALGVAVGGGDMAGFEGAAADLATRLGLADSPVIHDPAGLDDDRSWDGGNRLSARDLAIAARAYLADDVLRVVAATPDHEWVDPTGRDRSVRNLNAFLTSYEGAIGLKTGYTSRAGRTFVGAAERDGRTLAVVVIDSDNHYAHARELLDAGFLLAAAGERTGDVLPAVPDGLIRGAPATTTTTTTTEVAPTVAPPSTVPVTEAPMATAPEDDADEDLHWIVGGAAAGAAVAAGGLAVAARTRQRRHTIDRRPVRPRRRDRRRARKAERTSRS